MKILSSKTLTYALVLTALVTMPKCGKDTEKPVSKTAKAAQAKSQIQAMAKTESTENIIAELEQAIIAHPDDVELKVKLADCYVDAGKFKQAGELYRLVYTLYPADSHFDYARFREIVSLHKQAFNISVECDSSELEAAIAMCHDYLNDSATSLYKTEVEQLRLESRARLLDKTISVFNFHIRKSNLSAAAKKLEIIRGEFLSQDPSLEPRVLYLECKLAKSKNDKDFAQEMLTSLNSQYPESQFTRMAEGVMQKKKFLFF